MRRIIMTMAGDIQKGGIIKEPSEGARVCAVVRPLPSLQHRMAFPLEAAMGWHSLEGARVPRFPPPRTRRLAFAQPHVNARRPR
jgi:hypothetical protein